MNLHRILSSLAIVVFAGSAIVAGTGAFFSDTETSSANTFTSGAIDLTVDSEAHYNGHVCVDGLWQLDQTGGASGEPDYPRVGTPCGGTWARTDLGPTNKFFDYGDLKPGDHGENTISLHVENNDAWSCAYIQNVTSDDNGLTEPEVEAGDEDDGAGNGELADEVNFFAWDDQDGDNVWEPELEENYLFSNISGNAITRAYPLHTPDGGISNTPMAPGQTQYIGLYWCYGAIGTDGGVLTCNGQPVSNVSQTDTMSADITFYAEQSRNNPDFECPPAENVEQDNNGDQRVAVGATFEFYNAGKEPTCAVTVDDDGATGYQTIQSAIDDVNVVNGSTICVETGNYNEFHVDRPLIILGLRSPDSAGAAVVRPSSSAITNVVHVTSGSVQVTGLKIDGNGVVSQGSQMAGIQISPDGADVDGVRISSNIVTGLSAGNSNAANKGIQWHDGSSSGSPTSGYRLTNSFITNNIIDGITAVGKGGYGFQSVGDMDNVQITRNTIKNVTGAWGAGIALDAWESDESLTSVVVAQNELRTNIWSNVSVQVEHKVDQAGVAVNGNNILAVVHGDASPAAGSAVNAENNWWGDTNPSDNVSGPVDFTPFELTPFALN